MRDAEACLRIEPEFAKGYLRRSKAFFGLGRYEEAEVAAFEGLAKDPFNQPLKKQLDAVQRETAETAKVQTEMHRMRSERAQQQKMKKLSSTLKLPSLTTDVRKGFEKGFGPGSVEGLSEEEEEQFQKLLRDTGGVGPLNPLGAGIKNPFGAGYEEVAKSDDEMRVLARAMAKVKVMDSQGQAKAQPGVPTADEHAAFKRGVEELDKLDQHDAFKSQVEELEKNFMSARENLAGGTIV